MPDTAVAVAGLGRRYGERSALSGVTFSLAAGQTMVVFGPNGAGKSTLLRLMATLLRPHSGSATVLGHDVRSEAWKIRGRIGLLGHEPLLYRDLSARQNLRFHARLHGVHADRVEQLLDVLQLITRADDPLHTYSRGMVQRTAAARAVLHEPDLLLLDEPTANLDPHATELLEPLIGASSGLTRIVTSHDPAGGLAGADIALGLRDGKVALLGPADRRRARPAVRALHGDAVMLRTVRALVGKDLALERRVPQMVPAMALFSLTTFVVFHFALQRDSVSGSLAAGVFTATVVFAAMLGIGRLFVSEHEDGGFDGFLLAPVDRTALLVAKATVLMLFLVLVQVVALPAFALLLLDPPLTAARTLDAAIVLLLVDAGIAVIGALVGALAIQTRARDLLVPLIALPLLLPIVIGCAESLSATFASAAADPLPGRWLMTIGLYDLVFALLAFALFDYLIED